MEHVKIKFLGLFDEKFKYKILIGDESFDYWTGLGWCNDKKTEKHTMRFDISNLNRNEIIKIVKAIHPFKRITTDDIYLSCIYIEKPKANDVLDCLFSDTDCGLMSFNEFCENFGYSNDSIKSLDIYRECMSTAEKIRKLERQGLVKRQELSC